MVLTKEAIEKAKEAIFKTLKEFTTEDREARRVLERARYQLLRKEKK